MAKLPYIWGEIVRGNCLMKGDVPTLSHSLFWYILLIIGTMKEIKLTQGKVALVDNADYDYLMRWKWFAKKQGKAFYAAAMINGKMIRMHRLIMQAPSTLDIDHKDHNGLNNRRYNIRICTRSQNLANKTARGLSKYLGVSLNNHKQWRARIRQNKKEYFIGSFETEEMAARAYDLKAIELHGEFANINFK
jgi:hypothetical protein